MVDSTLGLYYLNDIAVSPFPSSYSFGGDTGETADDLARKLSGKWDGLQSPWERLTMFIWEKNQHLNNINDFERPLHFGTASSSTSQLHHHRLQLPGQLNFPTTLLSLSRAGRTRDYFWPWL